VWRGLWIPISEGMGFGPLQHNDHNHLDQHIHCHAHVDKNEHFDQHDYVDYVHKLFVHFLELDSNCDHRNEYYVDHYERCRDYGDDRNDDQYNYRYRDRDEHEYHDNHNNGHVYNNFRFYRHDHEHNYEYDFFYADYAYSHRDRDPNKYAHDTYNDPHNYHSCALRWASEQHPRENRARTGHTLLR
jgi:hypothetical protein